jgi:hypothetical protein
MRLQHREELLIGVNNRLHAIWGVEAQLWTCLAETGLVLRSGEDGYIQNLAWTPQSMLILHYWPPLPVRVLYSADTPRLRVGMCCEYALEGSWDDVLAFNSFWVVAMTLGNSCIAGRNFSCKSQMLG